ncbi:Olfactory receptor 14I1 [Varanus komodoensis]|nr:Olfactory receptor 14I1 [Varanus komodoensis]
MDTRAHQHIRQLDQLKAQWEERKEICESKADEVVRLRHTGPSFVFLLPDALCRKDVRRDMVNQTSVKEFLLRGFSDIRELQLLHFFVFLSLYCATLVGNFLIIVTVVCIHHLHTPMYFFLAILSAIDVCYISTTVPKSMVCSLMADNLITFPGCVAQVFLVVALGGAELSFLTVMAYDRYVAICHPLQYRLIMNWKACLQMAAASWLCSLINAAVHTVNTFRLHFCWSNVIEQYFCDIPHLLRISCSNTEANEKFMVAIVLCVGSFCFVFVLVSYSYIFSAVFKIQSAQGRVDSSSRPRVKADIILKL